MRRRFPFAKLALALLLVNLVGGVLAATGGWLFLVAPQLVGWGFLLVAVFGGGIGGGMLCVWLGLDDPLVSAAAGVIAIGVMPGIGAAKLCHEAWGEAVVPASVEELLAHRDARYLARPPGAEFPPEPAVTWVEARTSRSRSGGTTTHRSLHALAPFAGDDRVVVLFEDVASPRARAEEQLEDYRTEAAAVRWLQPVDRPEEHARHVAEVVADPARVVLLEPSWSPHAFRRWAGVFAAVVLALANAVPAAVWLGATAPPPAKEPGLDETAGGGREAS